MSPLAATTVLTDEEAARVVDLIRPCFSRYVSEYDERKYPHGIYKYLLRTFKAPEKVSDDDIRTALLWKLGHLAKRRIPAHHEALIACLQERWPGFSSATLGPPAEVFDRLAAAVEVATRYITVSFLLHLLRPAEVPIIDQHNFRAMNYYFRMVRPVWRRKSKPSTYGDLETLASFLSAIRGRWKRIEPCTVPSQVCLDRFLMMYGRALKSRKVKSPKASPNKAPLAPISDTSRGVIRLVPDPFLYWAATSDAKDNEYVDGMVSKHGGNYLEAINECVKEKSYGLH